VQSRNASVASDGMPCYLPSLRRPRISGEMKERSSPGKHHIACAHILTIHAPALPKTVVRV
jgi:hypothetical protein